MCKHIPHVSRCWPPTYPNCRRPVWKKLPSYPKNVLEKVVFPKRLFTAVHCSKGMWKMVRPRWLAVNVPYRRNFPCRHFGGLCTVCSSINHRLMYHWWMLWELKRDGYAINLLDWKLWNVYPFENDSARCKMKYEDHKRWQRGRKINRRRGLQAVKNTVWKYERANRTRMKKKRTRGRE